MNDYKETAVINIPKENFAYLREDIGWGEHVIKCISSELAERIMGILEREEEIVVKQSDLRVSEFMPTNSVEYRRQINWSPLVRCKDCKHYWKNNPSDDVPACLASPKDDAFCSEGERKEDVDH